MTMPPASQAHDAAYYTAGNKDLATETPVTVNRLETRRRLTKNSTRLVLALVGLPARGKSFVSRKLLHYLNWSGVECQIFNVGKYRRAAHAELMARQDQELNSINSNDSNERKVKGACNADFFDPNNKQAAELRHRAAEMALHDMLDWLDNEHDEDVEEGSGELRPSLNSRFPSSNSLANSSIGAPKLSFRRNERIAIFDATNTTNERRRWLLEECTSPHKRVGKPTGVVFIESICDDQELLDENYRYKISSSPDFAGMSKEEALQDLRSRVHKYEQQYETITDDSLSYMKIFNLSTKLMVNHIYGRMAKELVPALMSWHIGTRPVFLCRPGQTVTGVTTDGEDYVARKRLDTSDPRFLDMSARTKRRALRGDSLGKNGKKFREELLDYTYDEVHAFLFRRASVHDMAYTGTSISGLDNRSQDYVCDGLGDHDHAGIDGYNSQDQKRDAFPMKIFTSTMPRAADTVNWTDFDFNVQQMSNLNPLDKGDFAGMELDEIKQVNRKWYEKLQRDPYGTRFPGGESYRDLVQRLANAIIDIEQQVIPTLVVSHVSILQCLMAYFRNTPVERCTSIEVPMHTVIKYTPVRGGGWRESHHVLHSIDAHDENIGGRGIIDESESEFSLTMGGHDEMPPIWQDNNLSRPELCIPGPNTNMIARKAQG